MFSLLWYRCSSGILHVLFRFCQIRVSSSPLVVLQTVFFAVKYFEWCSTEPLYCLLVDLLEVLIQQSWWLTLLTEYWLSCFVFPQMTGMTKTVMMMATALMMMMTTTMMMMMMTRTCEVVAGDLLPTRAPSAPQPNLTQPLNHHDHYYSGIDDDDQWF